MGTFIFIVIIFFVIISLRKTNGSKENKGQDYAKKQPGIQNNANAIKNNPYSRPNSTDNNQRNTNNNQNARHNYQSNPYNRQNAQYNKQNVQYNRQNSQYNNNSQSRPFNSTDNSYNSQKDLAQLKERLASKYDIDARTAYNEGRTNNNASKAAKKAQNNGAGINSPANEAIKNANNNRQTYNPNKGQAVKNTNSNTLKGSSTNVSINEGLIMPNISALPSLPQDFLTIGNTNTLVLSDAPSSLLMGISEYDFSFWGVGVKDMP